MIKTDFKSKQSIDRIAKKFNASAKKAEEALKKANLAGAAYIWAEAKKRTPINTGELEASGEVNPVGPALKHSITFDTDYAAEVHDWGPKHGLGEASKQKQGGGVVVGGGYITRVLTECKTKINQKVAATLRRLLGGTSN